MTFGETLLAAFGGSAVALACAIVAVLWLRRHLVPVAICLLLILGSQSAQAARPAPSPPPSGIVPAGCVQVGLPQELGTRLGFELGKRAGEALGRRNGPPPTPAERMRGWLRVAWQMVRHLWDGLRAMLRLGDLWADFRAGLNGLPAVGDLVPGTMPAATSPPVVMSTNGTLSDVQVAALARAVGWPESEVSSGRVGARVRAESGNNPIARDYADGTHHGLLQLGTAEQAAYLAPGASADDPRANLRAARRLWEARGWQPWRASDRGHAQHLDAARAAAAIATPSAIGAPVACVTAEVHLVAGPAQNAAEAELSGNAILARRALLAAFPGSTIGGWGTRPNATEHDDRDHTGRKAARALDVMNPVTPEGMARGRQVNAWLLAHWDDLRIGYVIWDRRIWTSPTSSRPYSGASPHVDHNHVTLLPDGGTPA